MMNARKTGFMAGMMAIWGMANTVSAQPFQLPAPSNTVTVVGPGIQFATPAFDFGKVQAGVAVKHDFVFTNTGTSTLEVRDVRPSCGCTAAGTWQRLVEPGKTGAIPIQFNSANFSGPVHKTISVTCNVSNQPIVTLEFKGTVWKPLEVAPSYVYFSLMPNSESNEVRSVRVINNMEQPLVLAAPESTNPSFTAQVKEIRPGKEFEVLVKTVPPIPPGTVQGAITLKTSATNVPAASITVIAVVQQLILPIPSQLMLPAGPLVSGTRLGVTIRNNSPQLVSMSEPAFSVEGIETKLQEIQTGRVYAATMTFPPGFELKTGQRAELTVKTTHPQYPLVKIPVMQIPRPVAMPAPVSPLTNRAAANPVTMRPVTAAASPPSFSPTPLPPRTVPPPVTPVARRTITNHLPPLPPSPPPVPTPQ